MTTYKKTFKKKFLKMSKFNCIVFKMFVLGFFKRLFLRNFTIVLFYKICFFKDQLHKVKLFMLLQPNCTNKKKNTLTSHQHFYHTPPLLCLTCERRFCNLQFSGFTRVSLMTDKIYNKQFKCYFNSFVNCHFNFVSATETLQLFNKLT